MKQILFPSTETAELVDAATPDQPLSPTEVAGPTLYTAVSPGTELDVYRGTYDREQRPWGRFPFVPGYASVFRVERAGAQVADIAAGDLAFAMGTHQDWQRHERDDVIRVPDGCDPRLAPLARLMGVTMSSLTLTASRAPGPVAVTGLGPIGLLGALVFRRAGYRVLACDPIPARCELACELGLNAVERLPVDDAAHRQRYELVLECSAHEQAMLDGLLLLRKGGEMRLVGVPLTPRTGITAQQMAERLFFGHLTVRSGNEWQVPMDPIEFRMGSLRGQLAVALDWIADGSLPLEQLIGVTTPDDPQALYQDLLQRRRNELVTILDWTQSAEGSN
jgi:threonine dehydrogenase-like Zn-dependent dehydrogenase